MPEKTFTNLKVGRPANSTVEIEGEITSEAMTRHEADVFAELQKEFELPGFRKGQVPMEMIRTKVDRMSVLEDAAEAALSEAYPDIVAEAALPMVGNPAITLTKIAPDNPLGFKIKVALRPEVKLPNYKRIGKEIMGDLVPAEVSDAELKELLNQLKGLRTGADGKPLELTDESVRALGKFENLEDFKNKLRENLREEKQESARRGKREELAKKLSEESKMDLPEMLVEQEMRELHGRRHMEAERRGVSMAELLKQTGKTEEEVAKDEREYVERQLRTRFILKAIAEKEKLEPDLAEVEQNLTALRERHPEVNETYARNYVTALLRNEKVIRLISGEEVKK